MTKAAPMNDLPNIHEIEIAPVEALHDIRTKFRNEIAIAVSDRGGADHSILIAECRLAIKAIEERMEAHD
jgi:hypothetical protein